MLEKIIKINNKSEKELIFEIGSNSDLILENTITGNLEWTIKNFIKKTNKGKLTFPTKFCMVDSILGLKHEGRIIVRMSVNPEEIIKKIELGTSPLKNRIEAINKLAEADYSIGILIAPVILTDNWKQQYESLIKYLNENLSKKVREKVFFEIIFMTYSYVHNAINIEAFPNNPVLFDKEKMKGRGKGKYAYKKEIKEEVGEYLKTLMKNYFPNNEIKYIV